MVPYSICFPSRRNGSTASPTYATHPSIEHRYDCWSGGEAAATVFSPLKTHRMLLARGEIAASSADVDGGHKARKIINNGHDG